jgi:KDO2-lipid IV(A) lauroyltransferase
MTPATMPETPSVSPSPAPAAANPRPLLLRISHRLEYGAVLALEGLVRLLGPDRASTVSAAFWRRVAPRTARHTRALENLARAFPEKTDAEREAIARAMWANLGRTMAEGLMPDRVADPARIVVADATMAAVQAIDGRAIFASLHYGNWELVAWPLTAAGYAPAGVYQNVQNPLIDAHVQRLRGSMYPAGIHGKGHGTPRLLMRLAREGRPISILADHREMRGIKVPFFGHLAPSTPLPAFLARNLDLPLIAGRAIRQDGVRFRIEAEEVPVPHTADRRADVAAATAALQAVFERWIREDPTQWMWGHRRWDAAWRRRRRW